MAKIWWRSTAVVILCFGLGLIPGRALGAPDTAKAPASATPSTTPSSTASGPPSANITSSARPTPVAAPAGPLLDRTEVISFVGAVISWHRQIATEVRPSNQPEEPLFVADERRMAGEILNLTFTFAHAAASLVQESPGKATKTRTLMEGITNASDATTRTQVPDLDDLMRRRDEMRTLLNDLQNTTSQLRKQLASANRQTRDSITRQLTDDQARIDLVQSRIQSFDTLIDFEKTTGATGVSPLGFNAQIEELQHSVAQPSGANGNVPAPSSTAATSIALPGGLEMLLLLRQQQLALGNAIMLTDNLAHTVTDLRHKLIQALAAIDREGLLQGGQVGNADLSTIKQTTATFEALAARSKLIGETLEPLSKQIVLLQLYSSNLARWRSSVHEQLNAALRHQFFRMTSLALVFGAVFVAAAMWRQLTFRYIEDLQRRQKLLQLRRLAIIAALTLVILFGFTSELGTLATVMGFAAAGIAFALQNVILSIAGYFYLSGRFGIRIGDRVQIAGVTGDVLESGFFKLTLMELSEERRDQLPTGRAVIFPNSVVFQPSSNFFRQLPGTSFVWNELSLTLAPDCDYRQVEKLVIEAVNEVFAHYRDTVQREYRAMETQLNLRVETPRPQSRLQFGVAGLEMVIRYPTRLGGAMLTADEITRRLVDAIKREPGLKIAVPGVPTIQADSPPAPSQSQPGESERQSV